MIERYSDHAANERTFLAWVRTAIAIMAFGFLVQKFDLFLRIENQAFPWVYLNYKLIAARGLHVADVADVLADYLRRQDGVQAVYTRGQVEAALLGALP